MTSFFNDTLQSYRQKGKRKIIGKEGAERTEDTKKIGDRGSRKKERERESRTRSGGVTMVLIRP